MWRDRNVLRRIVAAALSLSAAALVLAAALPHDHGPSASSSHPPSSCRVCKLHETLSSATPVAPSAAADRLVVVALAQLPALEAPCLGVADRLHTPRAPPFAS